MLGMPIWWWLQWWWLRWYEGLEDKDDGDDKDKDDGDKDDKNDHKKELEQAGAVRGIDAQAALEAKKKAMVLNSPEGRYQYKKAD